MTVFSFNRDTLGPQFSEAARTIWQAYVIRDGWSLRFIAKLIGTTPARLSSWLYGDSLPSIRYAVKIEDTFGVGIRLWLEPPVKKFTPPGAE